MPNTYGRARALLTAAPGVGAVGGSCGHRYASVTEPDGVAAVGDDPSN